MSVSEIPGRLWWVIVFSHDPSPYLKKIKIPVMALLAGNDRVMPTEQTLEGVKKGLSEAGKKNLKYAIIPAASHSMVVPQEYKGVPLRRSISNEYLNTLVKWVTEFCKKSE